MKTLKLRDPISKASWDFNMNEQHQSNSNSRPRRSGNKTKIQRLEIILKRIKEKQLKADTNEHKTTN